MRFEWYAAPASCDVTEQAVFNLIPFAGSWWIVAHLNHHSSLVGQSLEFILPESIAMTNALPAVGSNQPSLGLFESFLSQPFPPTSDRLECELGEVRRAAEEFATGASTETLTAETHQRPNAAAPLPFDYSLAALLRDGSVLVERLRGPGAGDSRQQWLCCQQSSRANALAFRRFAPDAP